MSYSFWEGATYIVGYSLQYQRLVTVSWMVGLNDDHNHTAPLWPTIESSHLPYYWLNCDSKNPTAYHKLYKIQEILRNQMGRADDTVDNINIEELG